MPHPPRRRNKRRECLRVKRQWTRLLLNARELGRCQLPTVQLTRRQGSLQMCRISGDAVLIGVVERVLDNMQRFEESRPIANSSSVAQREDAAPAAIVAAHVPARLIAARSPAVLHDHSLAFHRGQCPVCATRGSHPLSPNCTPRYVGRARCRLAHLLLAAPLKNNHRPQRRCRSAHGTFHPFHSGSVRCQLEADRHRLTTLRA